MQTKQMVQAVAAAIGTAKPITPDSNNVTGRSGKPANAAVASINAIRKADKQQVQAKADDWADKGFRFAHKCEEQVESRRGWAFEFAKASAAQLRHVARGIVAYYAGKLEGLQAAGGHFAFQTKDTSKSDAEKASIAGRKQKQTMMQRRYELTSVINGFAALADMDATGGIEERNCRAVMLEELRSLGWNQLVAACASLHAVTKKQALTVGEAKRAATVKAGKAKAEAKADMKPAEAFAMLQTAIQVLALQPTKAKALGVDLAMLMRATGAKHDAAKAEAKRVDLRGVIKEKADTIAQAAARKAA